MTAPLAASLFALSTLCAFAHERAPQPDPRRQFDFWVGEWSVQNRHMQDDGSWRDGDVTRARITPVIGGNAILEEWAGPYRGTFMNGFSLRAWNPDVSKWDLLLFWTTDGNSSFGQLAGTFRHGRGEFFAGKTRYTFSDALADSVRWDSSTTADGGLTWKTDWIMEFSRERAAQEVTQAELFATEWTEGKLSPHAEARQLDWLIGSWAGTHTDAQGVERGARLACKTLDKDCLVLDVLTVQDEDGSVHSERLCVRGWEMRPPRWSSWEVSRADTRLHRSGGLIDENGALFERRAQADGGAVTLREMLWLEGDLARVELSREDAEGNVELTGSVELERVE